MSRLFSNKFCDIFLRNHLIFIRILWLYIYVFCEKNNLKYEREIFVEFNNLVQTRNAKMTLDEELVCELKNIKFVSFA